MTFDRLTRHRSICAGAPTLRSTRVSVEVIASRFAAGEAPLFIALDHGVQEDDIYAALRLVLHAVGTSLGSQRAQERIARVIPLEKPYELSRMPLLRRRRRGIGR